MNVLGVTSFTMYIEISSKWVPFKVTSLVIKDLSDSINLGSFFLKEHSVNLKFCKNKPLTLSFEKYGVLESIGCIRFKTLPETVRSSSIVSSDKIDSPSQIQVPKKIKVNFKDVQN